MTTLETVSGIQARIFTLPNRPPFMIAADLAEVYGTEPKYLTRAVKRNPERFPEDFMFTLSEVETLDLRFQNGTAKTISTKVRFDPLAFTHAGAYALSAVLKTPVAAEVSVIVHRAFAAMEQAAIADARFMVQKLRADILIKKPIYIRVKQAHAEGWTLDELWRATNYPRYRVEEATRELFAMGQIDSLLGGMQPGLFGNG